MSSINKDYRLAVSIEYQVYQGAWPPPDTAANPRVWFGSHYDIQYPTGVTPLNCYLREKDGVSKLKTTAQFFTGKHVTSKLKLVVVDKDGALSREIAQRLVDNTGTRRAIIRVFKVPVGEQIIDVGQFNRLADSFGSQVIGTYFFMDHDFDNGAITIECEDITSQMFTDLFAEENFVQTGGVSTDAEFVTVWQGENGDIDTPYNTFEHHEAYTYDPGNAAQPAVCGYKRFANTGEIFSHEPEDIAFQGALKIKERGVFGTNPDPEGNPAESTDDQSNGPAIENIVYLEEWGTVMAYAILTGRTSQSETQARILPPTYSFNIDPGFVNEYSFFGDTSNNGSADNLRLRILRDKAVEQGKTWVEKNIFGPLRAVMHINRFGQIELLRRQVHKPGSEVLTLTLDNIVEYGPLRHVKKEIKNPTRIKYDKSILDGKFKRILNADDTSSTVINQESEALILEFETLFNGINSRDQIDHIRVEYQEFYGHEHQARTIRVIPSLYDFGLQPGMAVRVILPKDRDDAQTRPFETLMTDRIMTIMSVEFDPMTCEVVIEVIGTLGRAREFQRSQNPFEIPDDKYPVDKDLMTSQVQITLDPLAPDNTFIFNGTQTIQGGRYWVPGNLLLNGTLNIIGHLELWVRGEFWINGTADASGTGVHKPGVAQTTFGGLPPPRAATGDRNQTMVAEGGFFGTPNAVGGTALIYDNGLNGNYRTILLPSVDGPSGEVDEMPEFHLSNECGCFRGIPPSMNGTPSSGTPISYKKARTPGGAHQFHPGLDGAKGGGSFAIVSRGGGFGPNGLVKVNGEDAPPPVIIDGKIQIANSGGMNGGFGWWTDGGIHDPPFTDQTIENHLEAYAGSSGAIWDSVLRPDDYEFAFDFANEPLYRQWWPPTDERINRAIAASIHQYVPRNQKLYESQNTHWLDSEADQNPDNLVKLWSGKDGDSFAALNADGTVPVPAPGSRDLWASQADIDSNLPQSQIAMYRYNNGVWEQITGYDATASLLLDVCRVSGASTIQFGVTRPTNCPEGSLWFDNENTDKAIRCGATPADDTLVWLRSYGEQGEDIVEDGQFLIHESCERTWMTDTNIYRAPEIYPDAFPKYKEGIVGSTSYGATIGQQATPGFQLDATGNSSYRLLRPRRPIRVHPGQKYIGETLVRTTGINIAAQAVQSPSYHGYTVIFTVFDKNGVYLGSNGNDAKTNPTQQFLTNDTTTLTPSGYLRVHHAFEVPDAWTDARYMVPNLVIHGLAGNVVVSEFHCRRLREFSNTDSFAAGVVAGIGSFGAPSNFTGQQYDIPFYQGSRFNFSTVADCTPSANCEFYVLLEMKRGGNVIKTYNWTKQLTAGLKETLFVQIDAVAQEFYDGYRWVHWFHNGTFGNVPGLTVEFHEDMEFTMNSSDVVESGTIT